MIQRDDGSWNAMIKAYSQSGFPEDALVSFLDMNRAGFLSTEITLASVLGSCATVLEFWVTRYMELGLKWVLKMMRLFRAPLLICYVKCGKLEHAHAIFDQPHSKNLISWTSIFSGYAMSGQSVFF
ncbi:putative pentatricopeptide [Rosa chinensis]|uniref:Putative pentatricopeptide n=1 Tax=Rosa chinensis TaxID=74649 RepID=A0A2P6REE2_ROSCH|nr:putative pentatricopeptide [Rosa chinensis]